MRISDVGLSRVAALMNGPMLDIEPQMHLPRILHQIYVGDRCPPALWACAEQLRRANPSWSYRFYDDAAAESFIVGQFGAEVFDVYRRISPLYAAARADLLRYLAVYRCGGVYLDVKSGADRSLDALLRADGKIWLSTWRNGPGELHEGWGVQPDLARYGGHAFQQWYVAAPAGHPYLRSVIDRVMRNILTYEPLRDGVGQLGVLRTTGPIAFTHGVRSMMWMERHEVLAGSDELGLRYSILDHRSEQRHIALVSHHYTRCTEPVATVHLLPRLRYRMSRGMHEGNATLARGVHRVVRGTRRRLGRLFSRIRAGRL